MKILITALAIAIGSITFVVDTAQAAGINQREAAQRHSIRTGMEDGSLTGKEAKRLRNQQVKMEHKEQRFRSDGELTRRERVNLQNTADANRARIYKQRHDDQVQEQ